ncbi:uncharacterized protein CG10915 [Contarinia nasturtii]|uniref:uncharacterized protein CG10915 n=1 Tax=Contarinia nasturtii TaxID=265458 RepID=UPI0012D3DE1A|nr:uncharacterized protein CG10915 [Contarinia nasturtii]XP_031635488.1 uncharacterized protein CG10915 [Contarinia nasturtii]XP_031635489.1 uncharacterized protein CG10915 [Contarinia nasturtii]
MDKKPYVLQSQPIGELFGVASGIDCDDDAAELSQNINQIDFQTMKAVNDTTKKNSKMQPSQSELLKMLSYMEGELQARDIVIAALKSEKLKNFINITRHKQVNLNDPKAALFRDGLALNGNYVSQQSSTAAIQSENEIRQFASHQLEILEEAIHQQRNIHCKLMSMMRDTEQRQSGLMRELEEEKRKHEHDTAQGDDITYGLEIERTRLRQELDSEKTARRKAEKDLKKLQETLEQERSRQKQIVLLLLAERKKIITKYIEERKRSEDLAQILSEEKARVDTIAEGLEEESKKSLRMEAELEKQMQAYNAEKKLLDSTLAKEEKRRKEQECEIAQLKAENDMIRKQAMPHRLGPKNIPLPQVPAKIGSLRNSSLSSQEGSFDESIAAAANTSTSASPMISSVTKVVQPTATVSSVPVSGPTTGIARSIPAGQSLRQQPQYPTTINSSNTSNDAGYSHLYSNKTAQVVEHQTPPAANLPMATVQSGNTVAAIAASINTQISSTSTSFNNNLQANVNPVNNNNARGIPPPIPKNKPVIPPKSSATRESSATRTASIIPAKPSNVSTTTTATTTHHLASS